MKRFDVELVRMREEMRSELVEHILPFWFDRTPDLVFGGFVGRITHDGVTVHDAPKSIILNTRILWAFSAMGRVLGGGQCRQLADRAYAYLRQFFLDGQNGGFFWMLDHQGHPIDAKKQIYAQAFALYAVSEYHLLTRSREALALAIDTFDWIERYGVDPEFGGIVEAFGRSWEPLEDLRLSDKDLNVPKSMNTHLHVLEAYTNLMRVWPEDTVRRALRRILEVFLDHIVDAESGHLGLFFEHNWAPASAVVSFGHDIEASWLMEEAAEVLEDPALMARVRPVALRLVDLTLAEGVAADGSVLNERHADGGLDTDRHWWPQVEAIVGFLGAFGSTGEKRYADAALRCWEYTRNHLIDRRRGEWFFRVDASGQPYSEEDKVGPWKAPYHTGRAVLEVLRRV